MSFLLAFALQALAGLALLRLLRLGTGSRAADAPLAWFVGSGWVAAVAPVVRFAMGIPMRRPALLAILLAPPVAWLAVYLRSRFATATPTPTATPTATSARWLPRPLWLFVPIAAYVVLVAGMAVLHGTNSPTQTDDAVRVRAFAPVLAYLDAWSAEARGIFSMAGPLSAFVPAVGWIASGALDHFHVNYAILADLVALLSLAIALGSARGSPERGWASALGLLSVPLFVYHATQTYSDAVLAMRVGAGMLFALEYSRTRDRGDASRALLLLGIAALVKREGELVALAPMAVLVAWFAWERWRDGTPFPWSALPLAAAAPLLGVVGKIAALGLAGAFPMLGTVTVHAGAVATGTLGLPQGTTEQVASLFFNYSLFRVGNQGMLYWIAAATIVLRAKDLARGEQLWPLLAVAAIFGEVAVSSVLLFPAFTLNQGTVHRALLTASVPLALWTAATLVDAVHAETRAPSAAPVKGGPGGEGGAEGTTQPGRRRSRRRPRP
jgi:hypothetical protein